MPRYRITIAYDGTDFHGMQRQPKQRTVQETLEKALFKMSKGQNITVFASGRTDAGVHALGQVVHFDYPQLLPVENMRRALISLVPLDILIVDCQLVTSDFHAQFSTIAKCYRYRVNYDRFCNPFARRFTGHYPYPLNQKLIQLALPDIEGTHDFASFKASGGVTKTTVRKIYRAEMWERPAEHELVFEFIGTGFLYNMVRIMVATLLEIGNGRRDPHDFIRLYAVKDRQQARVTAPASGLYLTHVFYQGEEEELQQTLAGQPMPGPSELLAASNFLV